MTDTKLQWLDYIRNMEEFSQNLERYVKLMADNQKVFQKDKLGFEWDRDYIKVLTSGDGGGAADFVTHPDQAVNELARFLLIDNYAVKKHNDYIPSDDLEKFERNAAHRYADLVRRAKIVKRRIAAERVTPRSKALIGLNSHVFDDWLKVGEAFKDRLRQFQTNGKIPKFLTEPVNIVSVNLDEKYIIAANGLRGPQTMLLLDREIVDRAKREGRVHVDGDFIYDCKFTTKKDLEIFETGSSHFARWQPVARALLEYQKKVLLDIDWRLPK